ncbi:MAG TPA: hypothetical protein VLF91_06630 [Candidatus Saccharimonadales bacterium]|nr:hypothetical protein [Candidatus Saccharimonadales bacterium]
MHHVIYVPGLGDQKLHGQRLVVKLWRVFGVRGHLVSMHWADKKPFEAKLKRLLARIDELAADPYAQVSLVASSAGASAVLLALAARPQQVGAVAIICGKVHRPEIVNPAYYRHNPAFKQALAELQVVLPKLEPTERYRILSLHPLRDQIVPPADTVIRGARNRLVLSVGHALSIALCLTLYAPVIMRFIKTHASPPQPEGKSKLL